MNFLRQLRGELRKLFGRPRSFMGYAVFVVMEALILTVYKFGRGQEYMRDLIERNGYSFATYFSSLSITFMIMTLAMTLANQSQGKEGEDRR